MYAQLLSIATGGGKSKEALFRAKKDGAAAPRLLARIEQLRLLSRLEELKLLSLLQARLTSGREGCNMMRPRSPVDLFQHRTGPSQSLMVSTSHPLTSRTLLQ